MKLFYLYKIVNTVNDKVYIGVTSRLKERRKEHFSKSSKCSKLRNAMDKYGRENFEFVVLCCGLEDYIIDLEFKAIDLYNSMSNGYNILYGHPNQIGVSMPEETRRKMSESLLKFYQENPNYLKENRKPYKRETTPCFVSGFWFPSKNKALEMLRWNEKSFYRRRKAGVLGDVCVPYSLSVSHSPKYVLGFWFPNLIQASSSLKKEKKFLQHLIRKNDLEQSLIRVGTKVRTKDPSKPIGVNKHDTGIKYRAVLIHKKEIILRASFDTEEEAAKAYDDAYENIHGIRPNKTQGISLYNEVLDG